MLRIQIRADCPRLLPQKRKTQSPIKKPTKGKKKRRKGEAKAKNQQTEAPRKHETHDSRFEWAVEAVEERII